jgi:hypothetical protein
VYVGIKFKHNEYFDDLTQSKDAEYWSDGLIKLKDLLSSVKRNFEGHQV